MIPFIPETAPFTDEQRAWLNGFLAGTFARQPSSVPTEEPIATPRLPVTVVWGSQTGNAELLAKDTRKKLEAAGAEVTVFDLADYPKERLAHESYFVVITSTYGEGEPPDNAQDFHTFLLSEAAPRLEGVYFAVLALGDTNYPDFCQTGKQLDARMAALGAQRWLERVDCDVEFEEPFEMWIAELAVKAAAAGDQSPSALTPSQETVEEVAATTYSKKRPFPAALIINQRLNAIGSSKDTRHVSLSLAGSRLNYEVGDALGVRPHNAPETVFPLIEAAGFTPGMRIGGESLASLLTSRYDVCKLTLGFLQDAARFCDNPALGQLVTAAEQNRDAFIEYAWGRELIDAIEQFRIRWPSPEAFVQSLKKITPRLYSISSSPKAHPEEVHLTVGVVRYESHGRARAGLCSTYLAELDPGSTAEIYVQPNKHFKPPPGSDTPMIMVGPGTGIAPFRAFLEEREAIGAKGKNWLFFGDQHAATDFLYRETIEAWLKSGHLTELETAFSRDQATKVYVQDRMRARGRELARWLEEGAHLYVCGDASRMAKDVDCTLRAIVAAEITGGDTSAADHYVDALSKAKRYVRDVY